MAKDNSGFPVLLVAGGIFALLYLSGKMKAGLAMPGSPASSYGPQGSSCNGQVNATTPVTATIGRTARPGGSRAFSSVYANGGQADYAPTPAPGSNANAPGSGGNWQGLHTRSASGLTPPNSPSSPSLPAGAGVYVAAANPAYVSGGGASS
jgi:hypothetical protein